MKDRLGRSTDVHCRDDVRWMMWVVTAQGRVFAEVLHEIDNSKSNRVNEVSMIVNYNSTAWVWYTFSRL